MQSGEHDAHWNSFFGDQGGFTGANGDLQIGTTGTSFGETELRIKNAFVRFDVPGAPVTLTVGQQDFSAPKAIVSVEDYTGVKVTFQAFGGSHDLFWARLEDGSFDTAADDGDADAWQQIISTDLGWSPFFHDGSDNTDFAGNLLPGVADGGIIAVGAEFALSPYKNLTVTPNVYYLMAAEDVNASGGTKTDDFYGVEAGVQALYRAWDAVDLLAQFDYLFAGDVFEDASGDTKDAWRLLIGPRISW